jgi:hypothetical protein
MSNNKDAEFAARMEMITNKAAKDIVKYLTSNINNSMVSVVSLVKAMAIMLEASKAAGEDDEFFESIIFDTLKSARKEASKLVGKVGGGKSGN